MTVDNEQEEQCETKSASICSTSTSFGVTTTGTITSTTTTAVSSTCETVFGCDVTDTATDTTTTSITGACALPTQPSGALNARQYDPECGANAIVYPTDRYDVVNIRTLLTEYAGEYEEVGSTAGGYTSFFWVPDMDADTMQKCIESVRNHIHGEAPVCDVAPWLILICVGRCFLRLLLRGVECQCGPG